MKLIINAAFGKTMKNLRKRTRVELIINSKDYVKCISKPSLVSQKKYLVKKLLDLVSYIEANILCINFITNTLKISLMLIAY